MATEKGKAVTVCGGIGYSARLFPSPSNLKKHMVATAVDHALRKNVVTKIIPIEDVTPHDLRRTAASHMTSIGVSRLVVSKILNHAESGVTAVYDRHSYDSEKRTALDAWSLKLEEILNGKKQTNVVPMVKKGK